MSSTERIVINGNVVIQIFNRLACCCGNSFSLYTDSYVGKDIANWALEYLYEKYIQEDDIHGNHTTSHIDDNKSIIGMFGL